MTQLWFPVHWMHDTCPLILKQVMMKIFIYMYIYVRIYAFDFEIALVKIMDLTTVINRHVKFTRRLENRRVIHHREMF